MHIQLFSKRVIIHNILCVTRLLISLLSLLAVSCITTDVSVTCFYQNDTGSLFAEPRWYLDGQPIVPTSVSRYNDTVWQMKYNYCSLCPGEYVFHGKERELPEIEECCGSTPEVSINLTVTAGKNSIHRSTLNVELYTTLINSSAFLKTDEVGYIIWNVSLIVSKKGCIYRRT